MGVKHTQLGLVAEMDETKSFRNTLILGLFKNDVTPDEDTVIGDLTEANFGGYARQAADNWGDATYSALAAISVEQWHDFVSTGAPANDIYGYFLVDAGGDLIAAERNPDGPITISTAGEIILVRPRMTLINQ